MSQLELFKSTRQYIAFLGAIILSVFVSMGKLELGLLVIVILILSHFMMFGVSLPMDVVEILKKIEVNTAKGAKNDPRAEEEIKTTGGGALGGMLLGGLLGLALGPVGVLIGGMLGALAGNVAEYEAIKKEKGRR